MTNFMVKSGSGTGSGRICFTNPATSGSGRISQKQIRYSPSNNIVVLATGPMTWRYETGSSCSVGLATVFPKWILMDF